MKRLSNTELNRWCETRFVSLKRFFLSLKETESVFVGQGMQNFDSLRQLEVYSLQTQNWCQCKPNIFINLLYNIEAWLYLTSQLVWSHVHMSTGISSMLEQNKIYLEAIERVLSEILIHNDPISKRTIKKATAARQTTPMRPAVWAETRLSFALSLFRLHDDRLLLFKDSFLISSCLASNCSLMLMDEGCLKLQTHRKLGLSLPGTDARVQTVRRRHCQTRFLAFQG